MNHFKKKLKHSRGQALVEFALVITAVLMMIFLIIESARILWAWNSVQHAAREGARYATTGSFEGPDCVVDFGEAKFRQTTAQGGRDVCLDENGDVTSTKLRLASIIATSHQALSGLPINEVSTAFEDDYYYNIEVWGANESGQLEYDFAGIPNNPVIVRVTYMVPIITPFFRPIRSSIPVFGQEVLNNESFGQLGSTGGQALPPNLPPLPTAGVTPSPTPTPIVTDTPSPTPITPTATNTVTPICGAEFEGYAIAGQNFVWVTGEVGATVTIFDLTDNSQQIGIGTFAGPVNNHACLGFVAVPVLPSEMVAGHILAASPSVGVWDTISVLGAPPTSTPSPTFTPVPTATPSPTRTPLPSPTPLGPHIVLFPTCGTPIEDPGPVTFSVNFVNWPTNQALVVNWNGVTMQTWQAGQHAATFSQAYTRIVPRQNATYTITAVSGSSNYSASFVVPCTSFPTPTPNTTATSTPRPPDLVVYGPPSLISTPPIVAYQPVQFSITITNEGDIDVSNQFFVDIYLDPNSDLVLTTTIPITESDGYSAVSALDGRATKLITITAPLGFTNPTPHAVYGFVDSLEQITESREDNNITEGLTTILVTPAATPTPSATPGGTDEISGGALTLGNELLLQFRATMKLINDSNGNVVAMTQSDINGFYAFYGVAQPTTTYTVSGCITIDGEDWYGWLTGIVPPNLNAHVIMLKRPCL